VRRDVAQARAQHQCTTPTTTSSPTSSTSTPVGTGAVGTSGLSLAGNTSGVGAGGLPKPSALLEAPSIGLVAPVVNGTDDSDLAVAVGRVPASSAIGQAGTVVLAAHDVTWFSKVDQLHKGNVITLVMPCSTLTYHVTDQQVVSAGTAVYQTSQSRLVLVTCYPLNALFITSQRYLVDADLVSTTLEARKVSTATTAGTPTVPIPPALSAEGLGLDQNPTQLGTLTISGQANPAWQQSAAPLDDQAALLTLYFGAIDAARAGQAQWWTALAPDVPLSKARVFEDATIPHYATALNTTLAVNGSQPTGATLSAQLVLSGGDDPGEYALTMLASVVNGSLEITGWTMTPVSG
jgi:sortase A